MQFVNKQINIICKEASYMHKHVPFIKLTVGINCYVILFVSKQFLYLTISERVENIN